MPAAEAGEESLWRVLDALATFVGLLTPAGVVVELNRSALGAGGIAWEDAVGRPFKDGPWWSWSPAAQADIDAAIAIAAGGETVRRDVEVRALGEPRWIDLQVVPLRDEADAVVALVASGVDITERLELLARERAALGRARTLERVAKRLSAAVSVADVGAALVESLPGDIAVYASLALAGPDGALAIVATTAPEAVRTVTDEHHVEPETAIGLAGRTRATVVFAGPEAAEGPRVRRAMEVAGVVAAIAVPMLRLDLLVGAISVGFARRLVDGDVELVEALAEIVGQNVERARLYDEQRRIATTIQHQLLRVELPDVLPIAAHYRAAARDELVGGDFFDAWQVGEDTLDLLIGDVVGHGATAAGAMAQLRAATRALAMQLEPGRVLEELDRYAEDVVGTRYATLALVRIVLGARVMTVASAGHVPPVVLYPDGSPILIEHAVGPPLGVAGRRPRPARLLLPARGTLILYTDGLVERRGEPIDVGIRRLLDRVADHAGSDPDRLVTSIVDDPELGTGNDDVCAIAVRLPVLAAAPLAP